MNRQQQFVIIGAVLGAVVGAVGGLLYSRGVEEAALRQGEFSARPLPSGEIVRLAIAIMGVLRGVAELGQKA